MTDKRLDGRIALVTGASRGLGAAVAKRLAAEGAHVIAIARTVGGLEELDDAIKAGGGSATLVPLDLRDLDRIDPLGPHLLQRFGRLDIYVANAGTLGVLSPLSHLDPKVFSEAMTVNVSANWRLIRTLEPLLKLSDAGRAIVVTSRTAQAPRAYWGSYAVSQAGLAALARTWADEMASTNVKVNLVNPGFLRTTMRAEAFPGEDPATVTPPEEMTDIFVDLASPGWMRSGETLRAYRSR